jgi:preprotein translocase subunit Sec63
MLTPSDPSSPRTALLLLGWIAAFGLGYLIYKNPGAALKVYNPFEILGISSVSTMIALIGCFRLLATADCLHIWS